MLKMGNCAPPHVAILSSPGMGHLIPLTEFSKLLASHYGITVTLLTFDDSAPVHSFTDALPDTITHVPLPKPSLQQDLPPETKAPTSIFSRIARFLPSLREVVVRLKATTNLVALVVDLLGIKATEVAKELGVSPFVMFPSPATSLSFIFHLPDLDRSVQGEYRDHPQPIRLPGCAPIHGKDLPDPFQDRKKPLYTSFLQVSTIYKEVEGIFINTASAIEPGPIEELTRTNRPPVYPIGPLVQHDAKVEDEHSGCIKWLDQQPSGSVLFVSFGSSGMLSSEQFTELAAGLEMSGHRFLWVARCPKETDQEKSKNDPMLFLPDGFMERTKEVGMVVDSWAPQLAVLQHAATGGFLTHCGWNSSLESIVHCVPMITWPLFAEQKMNAVLLAEEMKVAIRPAVDENRGLIGREEISRVVRELMEGEDGMKARVRVKTIAENAMKEKSYKSLDPVVEMWKNSTSN